MSGVSDDQHVRSGAWVRHYVDVLRSQGDDWAQLVYLRKLFGASDRIHLDHALHIIRCFATFGAQLDALELVAPHILSPEDTRHKLRRHFCVAGADAEARGDLAQFSRYADEAISAVYLGTAIDAAVARKGPRALHQHAMMSSKRLAAISRGLRVYRAGTSNQAEIIASSFSTHGAMLTGSQTVKLMLSCVANHPHLVDAVASKLIEICVGLTSAQIGRILGRLPDGQTRLELLPELVAVLIDPERAEHTFLHAYFGVEAALRTSAFRVLAEMPRLPRSLVFGSVRTSARIAFVIDNGFSFTGSAQGGRSRIRFAASEIIRVLTECAPLGSFEYTVVLFNRKGSTMVERTDLDRQEKALQRIEGVLRRKIDEARDTLLRDTCTSIGLVHPHSGMLWPNLQMRVNDEANVNLTSAFLRRNDIFSSKGTQTVSMYGALRRCELLHRVLQASGRPRKLDRIIVVSDGPASRDDQARLFASAEGSGDKHGAFMANAGTEIHFAGLFMGGLSQDDGSSAQEFGLRLVQPSGGMARMLKDQGSKLTSSAGEIIASLRKRGDENQTARVRVRPTLQVLSVCGKVCRCKQKPPAANVNLMTGNALIVWIRASQVFGIAALIFFLVAMMIIITVPIGTRACASFAYMFPHWGTPMPLTFALWRPLVIAIAVAMTLLSMPSQSKRPYTLYFCSYMGVYLVLSVIALLLMQASGSTAQPRMFSIVVLIIMSAMLMSLYDLLAIGTHARARFAEYFADQVVSALVPWTVFSLVQLSGVWVAMEQIDVFGWTWEWQVVMNIMWGVAGCLVLAIRHDVSFAFVIAWVLVGIFVAHNRDTQLPRAAGLRGGVQSPSFLVAVSALLWGGVVILWLATELGVNLGRAILARANMKLAPSVLELIPSIVRSQALNLFSYVCLILVNFFAASTHTAEGNHEAVGYSMVGLTEPPLNGLVCGAVAYGVQKDDNRSVMMMPASFAFKIWWLIYAWLGIFVLAQLMPYEFTKWASIGTDPPEDGVEDVRDKDKTLRQKLFLRGLTTQWATLICCKTTKVNIASRAVDEHGQSVMGQAKKTKVKQTTLQKVKGLLNQCSSKMPQLKAGIPLLWRWKLTYDAMQLFVDRIWLLFFTSCICNVIFLLAFHYQIYYISTPALFALLINLAVLNSRIELFVWSVPHSQHKVKDWKKKVEGKAAKKNGDDLTAAERIRARLHPTQSNATGSEVAAAAAKTEDGDAPKDAKPEKKGIFGGKPLFLHSQFGFLFFVVQAPFGLYLGWVSFLTIPTVGHMIVAMAPSLVTVVISEYALTCIALGIATFCTLIGMGTTIRGAGPMIGLAYAWGLYAVFYENTTNSCLETTMAGAAYRTQGLMLHWDATEANCTFPSYTWWQDASFESALCGEGDCIMKKSRCRLWRAGLSLDECNVLGELESQGGSGEPGFIYVDDRCVEDPGTCPYRGLKERPSSFTNQFKIATTVLYIFLLIGFIAVGMVGALFVLIGPPWIPFVKIRGGTKATTLVAVCVGGLLSVYSYMAVYWT